MKGLKIFWKCDHIYNGKQYDLYSCPKCYGMGYYIDMKTDRAGNLIEVSGKDLVVQEVRYLLNFILRSNALYDNYGLTFDEDSVILALNNMLDNLRNMQLENERSGDELIKKWEVSAVKKEGIRLYIEIKIYLDNGVEEKISGVLQ